MILLGILLIVVTLLAIVLGAVAKTKTHLGLWALCMIVTGISSCLAGVQFGHAINEAHTVHSTL